MRHLAAWMSLFFLATIATGVGVATTTPDRDEAIVRSLDSAIDDERHAIAWYSAAIEKHGRRRPFSKIIEAERRHVAALLSHYARLGIEPPDDRWAHRVVEVPDVFSDACDAAAVAEIRNARLYDDLIASTDDAEVRRTFSLLRSASVDRHLPAFERHGSQWERLELGSLDDRRLTQLARANAAQAMLLGRLVAALSEALSAGSAADAISVCSVSVPRLVSDVANRHGVRIGRTSFRLRNVQNRPPAWADLALDERPTEPIAFVDCRGRLGALTPIFVASSCIQCHGNASDIAPETRRAIAASYPDDRAMGFAEGDLRGWFWTEVLPTSPDARSADGELPSP